MVIHVVSPGDSIYSIAKAYGASPEKIIAENELNENEYLVVGQTIVITQNDKPTMSIEVNGYALPGTNMETLKKTFKDLTYLSIFSYDALPDGSLKPIEDDIYIKAAKAAGVAPLMVVTNAEEGKGFSSEIAHAILTDEAVQNRFISEVLSVLDEKKYYGVNIDFEYIYPFDKGSYNQFLRKISGILSRQGYFITTAVAPKTSATMQGLLYEAHDYPVHGEYVNRVIPMTYEWGYSAGPPLPVAPINLVKEVIDYAVTVIPKEKILMGAPNYGYNWKLPYTPGTMAPTISNVGAVDLARRAGAAISFDDTAKSPFFKYYDQNATQHIVWFQDARSSEATMKLIMQYPLQGVSYWTLGIYFPQNWLVLRSMFNVKKVY